MRELWLLRHAKSSWDDPSLADHERPLAPRGRRAVRLLAEHVAAAGVRPELVLCSTARRARETVEPLVRVLGAQVVTEPRVYGASEDELLVYVRGLEPALASALVVGHNPSLALLLELLAEPGTDLPEKLPTGALAGLAFEGAWADLGPGTARLESFVVPRELSAE